MTTRASDVMRRWFRDVWCEGRPEAIQALFAPDGLAHGVGPAPLRGPQEFLGFWRGFRATFSDIHIEVLDALDEGPRTAVRCVATLRFQGRPARLEGMCVATIEGGKIVECWNTWDFLGLLVGMGTLPGDALPRAFAGARASFAGP